jgi:hypothetical protein
MGLLPYFWYLSSSVVTLLSVSCRLRAFLLRDSVHVMISFYGIKPNRAVTSLTQAITLASRYSISYRRLTSWLETDWTHAISHALWKRHNPCVRASGWNSYFTFGRTCVQILSWRSDISQEIFRGFVQTIQINTVIISIIIIGLQPLFSTAFQFIVHSIIWGIQSIVK